MTPVVRDETWYLPTYLSANDGSATLFTRRYIARKGPKTGRVRISVTRDAVEYTDADTMVAAIEDGGWKELPDEADGNPNFVPPEITGETPSDAEEITDEAIVEKIDRLKRAGLIEVHPDDVDKPWAEQRLRRTEFGDRVVKESKP